MNIQKMKNSFLFLLFTSLNILSFAQTDTTAIEEEEDYSIYEDLDFVDEGTKRYANVKIKGLSPQKLITVGYDFQSGYDMDAGNLMRSDGTIIEGSAETAKVKSTQGLRAEANIPVISKNSLIVQVGARYWGVKYDFEGDNYNHPLLNSIESNNLTSIGLNTTIYKPINETNFLIFRLAGDMNGDYAMSDLQPMKYTKYSIAAIWGKRVSDYKQWGVGLSRTYRAGELNYIPVVMYNWTSATSNWGTEILFPARGHVRYSLNSRNLLFAGFELEGNSYRIGNRNNTALAEPFDELEIRRGELRFRLMYERQITGFLWLSAQFGYRYDYSFNLDRLANGDEFFRGFFGDQEYVSENELTNPLYFNLSINLVSP